MSEMKSLTLNDKKYDGFVDPVARAWAAASAVINSASGESITVTDASDGKPYGLTIYGKTIQDGTPTPDAPVDLVSVGDSGNITVNVTGKNDARGMTIATPNGLPGIPVASGGNYTDDDGQQWICDEIDLARGVYVQRVGVKLFVGTENWERSTMGTNFTQFMFGTSDGKPFSLLCDKLPVVALEERETKSGVVAHTDSSIRVSLTTPNMDTSAFKTWLTDNHLTIIYPLAAPIETPLSEEEIAAYSAPHTYKDLTTVSNDAGAWMELEYVMDTKKYIDSLVISGGGSVARLDNVTLLASAWTGSDSLYSQVVTIDGITEYSKVDLLPSVEQLAIFHNKDVAFVTENEDGVVTVFAIGDKPTQDYTMQVSITEVTV